MLQLANKNVNGEKLRMVTVFPRSNQYTQRIPVTITKMPVGKIELWVSIDPLENDMVVHLHIF